MTEAIFGLIGVIVGGVLQTGANWWMERRREDWAARKAGRLLAPAFGRSQFILDAAAKVDLTWGVIGLEIDDCLEQWPKHADVLAPTPAAEQVALGAEAQVQREEREQRPVRTR